MTDPQDLSSQPSYTSLTSIAPPMIIGDSAFTPLVLLVIKRGKAND